MSDGGKVESVVHRVAFVAGCAAGCAFYLLVILAAAFALVAVLRLLTGAIFS